jgi:hypothetical protein
VLESKKGKGEVDYTPHAEVHSERCELCQHFRPMYEQCAKVQGYVKPAGWCKLFERRAGR